MSNRLDAKDAFAFSIDLQSQLAAVQLEDRQIIELSPNFGDGLKDQAAAWA
jgi:hypothetical protein